MTPERLEELRKIVHYDDGPNEVEAELLAEVDALTKRVKELEGEIRLLLDHVDYTNGACGVTEMVGGVLPREVIDRVRAALLTPDAGTKP